MNLIHFLFFRIWNQKKRKHPPLRTVRKTREVAGQSMFGLQSSNRQTEMEIVETDKSKHENRVIEKQQVWKEGGYECNSIFILFESAQLWNTELLMSTSRRMRKEPEENVHKISFQCFAFMVCHLAERWTKALNSQTQSKVLCFRLSYCRKAMTESKIV